MSIHITSNCLSYAQYVKYVDDIFLIWQHGPEEMNKFVDHINSRTDSMKFTMELSGEEISFLDTFVKFWDRTLYTDLYCKPYSSLLHIRHTCISWDASVASWMILTNMPQSLPLTSTRDATQANLWKTLVQGQKNEQKPSSGPSEQNRGDKSFQG